MANYNRKNRIRKYNRPSGDFVSKAEFNHLKTVLNDIRFMFSDYLMEQPNKEMIKLFARREMLDIPIIKEMMTTVSLDDFNIDPMSLSCKVMRINRDEAKSILRSLKMIRALAYDYDYPTRIYDKDRY